MRLLSNFLCSLVEQKRLDLEKKKKLKDFDSKQKDWNSTSQSEMCSSLV